jgi:hypothetical protein
LRNRNIPARRRTAAIAIIIPTIAPVESLLDFARPPETDGGDWLSDNITPPEDAMGADGDEGTIDARTSEGCDGGGEGAGLSGMEGWGLSL